MIVKEHVATPGFTTKIFIIITATESMSSMHQLIIPVSLMPTPSRFCRLGGGGGGGLLAANLEALQVGLPVFTSFVFQVT